MSDDVFNRVVAFIGGAMAIAAHTVISGPWAQFVGELGTLIAGQALLPRKGDYPLSAFPKYVQDSVRPPK